MPNKCKICDIDVLQGEIKQKNVLQGIKPNKKHWTTKFCQNSTIWCHSKPKKLRLCKGLLIGDVYVYLRRLICILGLFFFLTGNNNSTRKFKNDGRNSQATLVQEKTSKFSLFVYWNSHAKHDNIPPNTALSGSVLKRDIISRSCAHKNLAKLNQYSLLHISTFTWTLIRNWQKVSMLQGEHWIRT